MNRAYASTTWFGQRLIDRHTPAWANMIAVMARPTRCNVVALYRSRNGVDEGTNGKCTLLFRLANNNI